MKKTKKLLILLTIAAMLISTLSVPLIFGLTGALSGAEDALLPGYEEGELCEDSEESNFELAGITTVNATFQGGIPTVTPIAYTASGYKSYYKSDAICKWTIPNGTVGTHTTTAMQGMNVGTTYIYTAKIHNDEKNGFKNHCVTIYRTNANSASGTAPTEMSFYSSLTATKTSQNTVCGHANALSVVTINSVNYLNVLTGDKTKGLVRMKIDGTALRLTGYFKFVKTNGDLFAGGGFKAIRHADNAWYYLIKSGFTFYTCKIPDSAAGGTASNPTAITCYKLFTIDTANAVFATSSTKYSTVDDLITWIGQDFSYSSDEQAIYVPYFSGTNDNVILVYDVSSVVTAATMAQTSNNNGNLLFPTTLGFRIKDTSLSSFEIESTGFRTGQGTTGDKKLYFSTNSNSANEGIWQLSYQRGSYTYTNIKQSDSIVYKVHYDGNGGTEPTSEEKAATLFNISMADTNHIKGIAVKLRPNTFKKTGYEFLGWYLTRQSDGKALYFNEDESKAYWYTEGSQPSNYHRALYVDGRKVSALSSVNGDVVTCTAQWAPVQYTVKYVANGGSGSMSNTTISYGIGTQLRANAFTRSGYTFLGWYLTRQSDGKSLYFNVDNSSASWHVPGSQPEGYHRALYADRRTVSKLTAVKGDVVTCTAQWAPNTTATTRFVIRYDANGGTGSMADTIVTKGTSTATRANAFTKSGKTFKGWNAYRLSDNKWFYVSSTDSSKTGWYVAGTQPSGYVLYKYSSGQKVANTSSVNCDIVTFYAVWQ